MHDISVITIVKNRAPHLKRLLDGLGTSGRAPREIIIVDMSDAPVNFAAPNIPHLVLPLRGAGLPLAAARNRGAAAASGSRLLFLDVDCIPRPNLVAAIDDHLMQHDHLVCAEVRYLGPGGAHLRGEEELHAASVPHPHRVFPSEGVRLERNFGLFWCCCSEFAARDLSV